MYVVELELQRRRSVVLSQRAVCINESDLMCGCRGKVHFHLCCTRLGRHSEDKIDALQKQAGQQDALVCEGK